MKCEICHEADAATVLHRPGKNGADEELYVCKTCARNARKPKRSDTVPGSAAVESAIFEFGPGKEPPPFVKNLLDATFGLMQSLSEDGKCGGPRKTKCPACGRTLGDVLDGRPLGCPKCWETFGDAVLASRRDLYGDRHAGPAPENIRTSDPRARLERALAAALAKEDYKKAAEIRRKLDALDAGTPITGDNRK